MFGYEADAVTIVPEEAQAIRDAAEMVIAGKTLREVIRTVFTSRGLTTTLGNPMSPFTIRDILLNPRVRGISTFQPTNPETGTRLRRDREIIGPGQWPAIIDAETGEKLDAVLKDPSRRRNHVGSAPTKYLASVLICTCGEPMYSRSRIYKNGKRKRYYSCKREIPGLEHVSIGDDVDDLIDKVILARMAKPDALEVLRAALTPEDHGLSDKMQELFGQRAALLSRREALEQSVVDGDMEVATFARLEKKIAEQLEVIDAELQEVTASMGADPLAAELNEDVDFAGWWEDASVEDKRRFTQQLMDIHILPGKHGAKSFDPTRVKITWKN